MRWLWAFFGALLFLAGSVWGLQGFGVIPGSIMSNSLTWAIIGPVTAIIGVALIVFGLRPKRSAPSA
jgi:hypothetical protein